MKKIGQGVLFLLFVLILVRGSLAYHTTQEALSFWFNQLVPSMFVTMVLVTLCLNYRVFDHLSWLLSLFRVLFNLDQSGISLFLSCLLLGAPAGATLVNQLVKEHRLTQAQAQRLICCLSLATPSFIVMTCGAVFLQSLPLGFLLWGIQILICMLFMLLWRKPRIALNMPNTSIQFFPAFKEAVKNSGIALFYIGGYLMMFLTLLNITTAGLPEQTILTLKSIGEFSLGCSALSQIGLPVVWQFALTAAILGFNGLCVHLQVFSLCDEVTIPYPCFLFLRVIQACLGFSLGSILFLLLL